MIRRIYPWLLLAAASIQFTFIALPPGNADLISIQSLALDIRRGDTSLLYPGRDFLRNEEWVAHHEANLARLGARGEPNWCFYPPLIPWLATPIAEASAETWRLIWGGFQFSLIIIFVFLIKRLLIRSGADRPPSLILIFALILGSYPAARSVELGQTSLAIAVMLWGGIYSGIGRAPLRRGIAIGASSLLKPFLVLAEVPYLFQRKWTGLVTAAATWFVLMSASVLAAGWSAHRDYADFLITLGNSQTAYAGNQSLMAGLLRLFSDMPVTDYGFLTDSMLAAAAKILAFMILAGAAWAQWRSRVNPVLSCGLWLSSALIVLPISWEHHLIVLAPVIAFLWSNRRTSGETILMGAATVLLTVCWAPLYGDDGAGRIVASFPLFGNLMVFSFLLTKHVRSKPHAAISA